jgi:hypothetical protein
VLRYAVPCRYEATVAGTAPLASAAWLGTKVDNVALHRLALAGTWFRSFVMDEVVRSVDALSREQLAALTTQVRACSESWASRASNPIVLLPVRARCDALQ